MHDMHEPEIGLLMVIAVAELRVGHDHGIIVHPSRIKLEDSRGRRWGSIALFVHVDDGDQSVIPCSTEVTVSLFSRGETWSAGP